MLTFPSAPKPVRHLPQGHWPVFGEPRKSTVFSRGSTHLTVISQISQNPPHTLPVHVVVHIPWSHFLSGIFILTCVNNTSSRRPRQYLRSSWHLTNPCAKRKVLSLTKPKGRIYKTKSLGHYITICHKNTSSSITSFFISFVIFLFHLHFLFRSTRGLMSKVLFYSLEVCSFELQSFYYVHFRIIFQVVG